MGVDRMKYKLSAFADESSNAFQGQIDAGEFTMYLLNDFPFSFAFSSMVEHSFLVIFRDFIIVFFF